MFWSEHNPCLGSALPCICILAYAMLLQLSVEHGRCSFGSCRTRSVSSPQTKLFLVKNCGQQYIYLNLINFLMKNCFRTRWKSLNWSYGVRDQQLGMHLPMPNSFGNGLHKSDSTRKWALFVRHVHVAPSLSIVGPCSTATWHPALCWRSYAGRTRERGTIVRSPTPPTRVGKWIVTPPPGGREDNYEPNEMTWQCSSFSPLTLASPPAHHSLLWAAPEVWTLLSPLSLVI